MGKVLVVYSSRTGNTRAIAEAIAEGIRLDGSEPRVVDVKAIQSEKDFSGYDAYVFGSATYHGEMMEAMKTMLFVAEKAGLEGRVGGAFGAYGWSGEAPERIYDTMKNVFGMQMVEAHLKQKAPSSLLEKRQAQEYGRTIARKLMAVLSSPAR